MFSKNLILAAALVGQAYGLTINTPPSLVQCQPASITFSEGTAPYILAVIPGGQVSAAAIETIDDNLTSSPITWNVNLASGTSITLKITDSTGTIAYSSPLTIQAGSSSSCLNTTAATSGVSTGAVTTTVSSSGTASAVSNAVSTTSTTSAAGSASASTSRAASAASSAAGSATSAAGSVTSAAGSAVGSATSAAASAAASAAGSGALANKVVALPAVALAVVGGLALLL
ncbi:hypothetical protein I204_03961 [Kwoniella mangroviensis CBS 8886]|uniref:uncharacterized protein n=1 Tax=Kwoniella mangroviensis CBS 8507 TaxID=1296122 RepID=UPI00080CC43A|nr:uncharacterized protein I203_05521 [Kwoniella mangroviensis CBS 8507]OCF65275.1 hypothetical protein I203_05521 [Kwoniella mangroviensis CBS 8507]OCF75112.1 hypothetical protein I204_03961 [Kwoniella mangroviensis CBS 8886]